MSDFEDDHGAFKKFTGVKQTPSVVHAYQGTPTAKTILITNNYTTHQNEGTKGAAGNSITIVTSPRAEPEPSSTVVSIRITNHYDGQVMNIKEEKKDPDPPKVAAKGFKEGDDVLVQQDDGKFFFGTVVIVTATQCLIKYDDNTKKWAMHSQLKRFGADKDDEQGPLCVVCKKTHKDKVETCDGCGRGFHHRCSTGGYDNGNWYCHRCTVHDETESEVNAEEIETADPEQQIRPNYIEKLPYKLDSLHWDAFHKENKEQKYCYCGAPGEWFRQMLQCSRCQQWFHEKCIKKLQFPVFSGDRFYVFVCKLCNSATEFVRRLEMDWPDLVQIALYNLTLSKQQEFFHIDNVLMRYLNDMKYALQVSNQMRTDLKIREKILSALADTTRFKNGAEKRVSKKLWALRVANPPSAPFITLQQDGCPVTEHYIKSLFANTKIQVNFVHSDFNKIKSVAHKIRARMHGQYLLHAIPHVDSEDDSSKFETDDEIPVKFVIEREKLGGNTPPKPKKRLRTRDSLSDTSRESLKKPKTPAKTSKKRHSNEKVQKGRRKRRTEEAFDSSNDDDASSRSTLDFIIPPLKNFQGANNPFNTLFGRNEDVKKEEIMAKPVKPPNVVNNGGVRIVRTVRRRLSAKDIIIGPNQQVKRKKTKRKVSNGDVEVISSTMINTATNFLPFRTEFKDWNNSSNSSSSLLPSQATSRRSSSASLTNGQQSDQTTLATAAAAATPKSEMPSVNPSNESVTAYFAAINRIRNGEGYRMLGRRKNSNGKIQYLIEWNGNGNISLF